MGPLSCSTRNEQHAPTHVFQDDILLLHLPCTKLRLPSLVIVLLPQRPLCRLREKGLWLPPPPPQKAQLTGPPKTNPGTSG
jgi:hypothetical protein|mmetsp:Transcript_48144/g.81011  ORF Transcript_48144/g.81011 Transcript_48144/m.81011 type:complete len:81 (-) Transcript_48144:156-398(-)